jgi:prepilin signal peptidase PulO-like enzyme (type II secretory pathway)
MIIAALVIVGLCLGSFVNALVWRLHQQAATSKSKNKHSQKVGQYSIVKGRSMCPNCRHILSVLDLIPLLSWLFLKGKCRYCHKPISYQYPLVELSLTLLLVFSYIFWPTTIDHHIVVVFILWLAVLTGLSALFVYDARWFILPNKIIYTLMPLAGLSAVIQIIYSSNQLKTALDTAIAIAIGGGLFYIIYKVSSGKWIGGGDVRLGWLLGVIAGTPTRAGLLIFIAALLGSLTSIPLLFTHRLKPKSLIPFGPFLIIAIIIVQLFGQDLLNWYQQTFLLTA